MWHSDSKVAVYKSYGDLEWAATLNTGVWEHWAITYASGTAKVYRNGASESSGAISLNTVSKRLRIGSALHDTLIPSTDFKGDLDDIRIYNRDLNASEILQLYNLEKPPTPPNITSQPVADQKIGSNVTFNVDADGTG